MKNIEEVVILTDFAKHPGIVQICDVLSYDRGFGLTGIHNDGQGNYSVAVTALDWPLDTLNRSVLFRVFIGKVVEVFWIGFVSALEVAIRYGAELPVGVMWRPVVKTFINDAQKEQLVIDESELTKIKSIFEPSHHFLTPKTTDDACIVINLVHLLVFLQQFVAGGSQYGTFNTSDTARIDEFLSLELPFYMEKGYKNVVLVLSPDNGYSYFSTC